jgi:hypothetical protein
MKKGFNLANLVVGVVVFFVAVMFASYVWALYHTWIIIAAAVAGIAWVAIAIRRGRRNDEDGNGGQSGVHVHFH